MAGQAHSAKRWLIRWMRHRSAFRLGVAPCTQHRPEALARDIQSCARICQRPIRLPNRAALRYPNERMLMNLGADAVIHNDMNMGRWPSVLKSIQSQPVRKFEKLNIEAVFANASSSERMGYLELPEFCWKCRI